MSLPLPRPSPERRGRVARWLAARVDTAARTARHPLFWLGARDMTGVSVGLGIWAFMTGVAMVKTGMTVAEAVLMSVFVFAGSAQLAALPLIVLGAPMLVIWLASFCVNLRFVVFSLHLRQYLMFLPRARRLWLGYFTADATYVLFVKRFAKPATTDTQQRAQLAYLWGGNLLNWAAWQSMSLLGIFLGAGLPERWGLGFAGILALLALTCALATSRLRVAAALLAAIVATLTAWLPFGLNIIVAIAVAVAVCLMLESRQPCADVHA